MSDTPWGLDDEDIPDAERIRLREMLEELQQASPPHEGRRHPLELEDTGLRGNLGRVARAGSLEALAGAAHLFLVEFDAWLATNRLGPVLDGTGAGLRYARLREELALGGYVSNTPAPVTYRDRFRAAWHLLRGGRRG